MSYIMREFNLFNSPILSQKIIIVSRKLKARKIDSVLIPPPPGIDVEVREIWQPWLKNRCDFVVRYIVPNRVNILKIMESKKLFRTEVIKLIFLSNFFFLSKK